MWLKEAEGKLATIGKRTVREAGNGRRACWQTRSPNLIKTLQVETDGARGKFKSLPGETSCARAREESAEAVVVRTALERAQERRAEGTESKAPWSIVMAGKSSPNVSNPRGRNPKSWANPNRPRDAVAASGEGREKQIRTRTHEPRRDSNAGRNDGKWKFVCHHNLGNKLPWFQPPDAENRTSGGVGALTGATPSGRPDYRMRVLLPGGS